MFFYANSLRLICFGTITPGETVFAQAWLLCFQHSISYFQILTLALLVLFDKRLNLQADIKRYDLGAMNDYVDISNTLTSHELLLFEYLKKHFLESTVSYKLLMSFRQLSLTLIFPA